MAAIGNTNPTLLDLAKREDPNGMITRLVEALQQRNPILMDAVALEGNLPTGHRVGIRSGLPTVGFRRINKGVAASKSTSVQVDEAAAIMSGLSQVDTKLLEINGNGPAFRASEDMGFMQALNNLMAQTLFYGSVATNPEAFHGLTPRFNDLDAANASHVIDAGGSGSDQSSIWLIVWGEDTCFTFVPKGMTGGLQMTDLGVELVSDGANGQYPAARTWFDWTMGLCVKDWRYVVRICNVDAATSETGVEIISAMVKAYNRVYDLNMGRPVFYANRSTTTLLDLQIMNKSNMYFTPTDWHGRKINSFRGIPIVNCDALDVDEAEVTT